MKRWLLRLSAAVLAAGLFLSAAQAAPVLQDSRLPLADSMKLQAMDLGGEPANQERILTYTPGGDVTPMVVFGTTLYGRSTMDTMQSQLAGQGYTAVAAVNAAFFDMSNGLPMGMVVTDGLLRASGSGVTIGVDPDGTLRIGEPVLKLQARLGKETLLLHYNHLLAEGAGTVLYSRDYSTATKGTIPGYHVVLEADSATLALDSQLTLRVSKIVENTKSCAIPEGGFVLSLAESSPLETHQTAIRGLRVGDTVSLTVSIDRAWENITDAVGGGDLLVEGGSVRSDFWLDSAHRQAARTALGLKANGDAVLYTVDKGEASGGLTLPELAQRMVELGCVTAVNLDGGGSTCMGVTRPGEARFTTVNTPSDGQQRACANYLFFVRPTTAAGAASQLFVYPFHQAMLPGGTLKVTALAADRNYMPAELPGTVFWSATGGNVIGGQFTATHPGVAQVSARSGGLTGTAAIQVVETPTELTLLRGEAPVKRMLVECGTSVDLTAKARYLSMELAAVDSSFTWTVSPELGVIDANGLFTAGEQEAAGTLTVACGELSVTVPVETRINPMTDLEGHWAREAISQLYFRDVLKGSVNEDGQMVYRPDASMTRQEFVVALTRWLDVDLEEYAAATLPFADSAAIADWAADAMKAAHALGYITGSQSGSKIYANPTDTITREEAMTILARTAGVTSSSDALLSFPDEHKVAPWARPALTAMVEQGVIQGIDGHLRPQGLVTRAQVAKMLWYMDP